MNALNSIVIEGNVTEGKLNENGKVFNFSIESIRYYRNASGEIEKEVSTFEVEAWAGLADVCKIHCTSGRGIRIVGRLKQVKDEHGSKIIVLAEHVEFKPLTKN